MENTHWIYSSVYALLTSVLTSLQPNSDIDKKRSQLWLSEATRVSEGANKLRWSQITRSAAKVIWLTESRFQIDKFSMQEVDYFEMMCLCLCQAWEPLHSSEGFALAGSERHSWATQSRSLAAAGRLSQQPWPTWTLPHPNYQGNIRGGTACCNHLFLLYDMALTQTTVLACIVSRLSFYKSVCLSHTYLMWDCMLWSELVFPLLLGYIAVLYSQSTR